MTREAHQERLYGLVRSPLLHRVRNLPPRGSDGDGYDRTVVLYDKKRILRLTRVARLDIIFMKIRGERPQKGDHYDQSKQLK